jgi:hypothetical protein
MVSLLPLLLAVFGKTFWVCANIGRVVPQCGQTMVLPKLNALFQARYPRSFGFYREICRVSLCHIWRTELYDIDIVYSYADSTNNTMK